MPDYTCYCGRGFYLGYKDSKQLITDMERFCCKDCLTKYLNDQIKLKQMDYFSKFTPCKLSEPHEFWDNELQMYFRSSYESTVARYLEELKIPWGYEQWTLHFGSKEYTPDFLLYPYEIFLEVKGLWGLGNKKKLNLASKAGFNILLLPDYLIKAMRKG